MSFSHSGKEEFQKAILSLLGFKVLMKLVYNEQFGVIAAKLIQNGKFNAREWEAASQVNRGEQNPFVVKSLLAQKQDEYVIVLQEYSNMGDMENFIQKMPVLPISTIRAIMKQILLGLRLLHEKGIVHRDIKEPNILLHSPPGSGRVIFKIGDLGIVKILKNVNKETLMTKIGTAIFMAPEVEIGDRIADGKVDVWAAGLILYQLLCHEYPYEYMGFPKSKDFLEAQFLIRPTIIQDDIVWDLISKLLAFDKTQRLTAEQALQHEFFNGEQAINEIPIDAFRLAHKALLAQQNGDQSITNFDIDASCTVILPEIEQILQQTLDNKIAKVQQLINQQQPQRVLNSSKTADLQNRTHKSFSSPSLQTKDNDPIISSSLNSIRLPPIPSNLLIQRNSSPPPKDNHRTSLSSTTISQPHVLNSNNQKQKDQSSSSEANNNFAPIYSSKLSIDTNQKKISDKSQLLINAQSTTNPPYFPPSDPSDQLKLKVSSQSMSNQKKFTDSDNCINNAQYFKSNKLLTISQYDKDNYHSQSPPSKPSLSLLKLETITPSQQSNKLMKDQSLLSTSKLFLSTNETEIKIKNSDQIIPKMIPLYHSFSDIQIQQTENQQQNLNKQPQSPHSDIKQSQKINLQLNIQSIPSSSQQIDTFNQTSSRRSKAFPITPRRRIQSSHIQQPNQIPSNHGELKGQSSFIEISNKDQSLFPLTQTLSAISQWVQIQLSASQKSIVLNKSNKPIVSIEQLSDILLEMNSLLHKDMPKKNLFQQLEIGMKLIKLALTQQESLISLEMKNIIIEILKLILKNILQQIEFEDDVELFIQSELFSYIIEVVNIVPLNEIIVELADTIKIISQKGSADHELKIFDSKIIQILVNNLNHFNNDVQNSVLHTLINIVNKGINEISQAQPQSLQQQIIHQSSQSYSSLYSPSLITQTQSQFLYRPHPLLIQFEQQGIIKHLIENILMNEQTNMKNKKQTCLILDHLFIEGAQIPQDQQHQIIHLLFKGIKRDDEKHEAFESLSYLAININNHEAIFAESNIKSILKFEMKILDQKDDNHQSIKFSIKLLINLLIFGSQQTQQQIKNLLPFETLNKLKSNKQCEDQIQILISSYINSDSIRELVIIKRVVQQRQSEEQIAQLLEDGLLNILKDQINQIKKDERDQQGKKTLIILIFNTLIENNKTVSLMIIEDADFLHQYFDLISSLHIIEVKYQYISSLHSLTLQLPFEKRKILYSYGIIQLMLKIIDSEDFEIIYSAIEIIANIIKIALNGLKEGEQHPYLIQLSEDGTVSKLIQIFKNEDYVSIEEDFAEIFAFLYKNTPLPKEIQEKVVKVLKTSQFGPQIDNLCLLSECPDNHDSILSDDFANELLQYKFDWNTLPSLHLIYLILKLGNNENKLKVSSTVKEKVEKLINDDYLDEIIDMQGWDKEDKEEIKLKAIEILLILKYFEESHSREN